MKSLTRLHLFTLTSLSLASVTSLDAAAIIYEPYSQATGVLNGKPGGLGLSGNWTSTTGAAAVNVVNPPTLNYGNLQNAGGQANLLNSGSTRASITTTTGLATVGLLSDGATLWFSYVFQKAANGGSNEQSGFAFGTDLVTPAFNGLNMANSGFGLGAFTNSSGVTASSWTAGTRTGGTAAALQTLNTPTLVIGKIVWGANASANETITLYTRALNNIATEPTTGGGVRAVAGFDQTALDTISFGQRNSGDVQIYDEIRFGANYADVSPAAGIPEPSAAVLGVLGFLSLLRRRS